MRFIIKGEYFYQDRTLKSVDFFNSEFNDEDICIYEVFRIDNTIPLFIEDHLLRLEHSFKVANKVNWKKKNQLFNAIKTLVSANTIECGNIKLDFRFFSNGDKQFQAYFLPGVYPTADQIREGVVACFQRAERSKPTAKIYNIDVRGKANNIIEDEHVYETILVNDKEQFTEGSRSNLFFIINGILVTAPDELVLSGIIRKKVIELANKLEIPVKYEALNIQDLTKIEAAFISGTTPRILGLKQIENQLLDVNHPIIDSLRNELDKMIETYKLSTSVTK